MVQVLMVRSLVDDSISSNINNNSNSRNILHLPSIPKATHKRITPTTTPKKDASATYISNVPHAPKPYGIVYSHPHDRVGVVFDPLRQGVGGRLVIHQSIGLCIRKIRMRRCFMKISTMIYRGVVRLEPGR